MFHISIFSFNFNIIRMCLVLVKQVYPVHFSSHLPFFLNQKCLCYYVTILFETEISYHGSSMSAMLSTKLTENWARYSRIQTSRLVYYYISVNVNLQ